MTVRSAGPATLGVAVFVVALWAQTSAVVGTFYDDGIYVTLAKALAEGHGFRNIHLPDAPPGVHYPFLYPAMLSLLWRLWPSFPENVVLFQMFDAAMLGGAAWLLSRSAARWPLPRAASYAALAIGFTAFPLLTVVGVRFSEPLFLLLLAGAAAMADHPSPATRHGVVAGVLAGLSFLARSIGISVIAAVPLALWYRGNRRASVVSLVVALVVAAPWLLWTATQAHDVDPRIAANYGTYATEAGQAGIGAFLAGFDGRALMPIARLTIPILPLWLWYPMVLLLLGIVVWGAVRLFRHSPALMGSLGFYTALVSLWPYVPDRFMWPMLPLFALCVAAGMKELWRRGAVGRGAMAVLVIVLLVGYARRQVNSLVNRHFVKTAEAASLPIQLLAPAIASGTPPDAVIATEAEAAMYLYSGRKTVQNTLFKWQGRETVDYPRDTILAYFCESGVTHIALPSHEGGAAPLVAELEARGDSTVSQLFSLGKGPALYRFRCPA